MNYRFFYDKINLIFQGMIKERVEVFPALQEQAFLVKERRVGKHRAAEKLGRTLIPQILGSRENIEAFFAKIGTRESPETAILQKMCGAQVVRRNLNQPPRAEVLSFLGEQLIDENPLKGGMAAGFLEGIFLYPSRLYKKDQKSLERAIRV